jgi:tetratricopeptide (TPR) repeat protein
MKNIIIAITLLAGIASCNQGPNNSSAAYEGMLSKSYQIKDYQTAITAIHLLLQQDSSQRQYLDSLPELYVAVRNMDAAEYYTDLALKNKPSDEKLMQLKSLCLENKGDFEGTLDLLNKLYVSTQKITYLFQVTALQLQGGDMDNAKKGIKSLEEKMATSKDSVDFMLSATEKQKVPLKAAVYHLKAYSLAQNRDLMGAKGYWEKALGEYPQFMAAREAYMQLMQGARQ